MYSKKSQSELIENKDYNMVLLLPHNATKIKYFSKSFSIRFFLLVIKEYYVFLKVAANGRVYETFGISKRFPIKLQLLLIRAATLDKPLTAKCFIHDVGGSYYFKNPYS